MLDSIGDFLNTDFGLVATLTTIVGLTASALGNKMQEAMYSKIQAAAERQRQVAQLKARQSELKALIAAKQQVILEKQQTNQDKKQLKFTTIKEKLERKELTTAEAEMAYKQAEADANKTELELEKELGDLKSEMISNEMTLTTLGQTNASTWGTIGTTVSMVAGGLGTLISGSSA
jgi:glucan-binding YG repeat protein